MNTVQMEDACGTLFSMLKETDGDIMSLTFRNDAGNPLGCVIAVRGAGVGEVMEAVEKVRTRWELEVAP